MRLQPLLGSRKRFGSLGKTWGGPRQDSSPGEPQRRGTSWGKPVTLAHTLAVSDAFQCRGQAPGLFLPLLLPPPCCQSATACISLPNNAHGELRSAVSTALHPMPSAMIHPLPDARTLKNKVVSRPRQCRYLQSAVQVMACKVIATTRGHCFCTRVDGIGLPDLDAVDDNDSKTRHCHSSFVSHGATLNNLQHHHPPPRPPSYTQRSRPDLVRLSLPPRPHLKSYIPDPGLQTCVCTYPSKWASRARCRLESSR